MTDDKEKLERHNN